MKFRFFDPYAKHRMSITATRRLNKKVYNRPDIIEGLEKDELDTRRITAVQDGKGVVILDVYRKEKE